MDFLFKVVLSTFMFSVSTNVYVCLLKFYGLFSMDLVTNIRRVYNLIWMDLLVSQLVTGVLY